MDQARVDAIRATLGTHDFALVHKRADHNAWQELDGVYYCTRCDRNMCDGSRVACGAAEAQAASQARMDRPEGGAGAVREFFTLAQALAYARRQLRVQVYGRRSMEYVEGREIRVAYDLVDGHGAVVGSVAGGMGSWLPVLYH